MGIFDWIFSKPTTNFNENGENRTYYNNGNLREKFYLKNGIIDGDYYEQRIDGEIKQSGRFKSGKKQGKWFYLKRTYTWKVNYNNGLLSGKWELYNCYSFWKHDFSDVDKLLIEEGSCIDGLKDGEWKKYKIKPGKSRTVTHPSGLDVNVKTWSDVELISKVSWDKGVLKKNLEKIGTISGMKWKEVKVDEQNTPEINVDWIDENRGEHYYFIDRSQHQ